MSKGRPISLCSVLDVFLVETQQYEGLLYHFMMLNWL